MRSTADSVDRASGQFRLSSQELASAAAPIRGSVEAIEGAMRQLGASTEAASTVVVRSAEQTARSAADALAAATEVLGGHKNALESTLSGALAMLERLKGQGARFDEIDEKLGVAFDAYTNRVDTAVRVLFDHVKTMQEELAPALATLRTVVDRAEQFIPQSGRR
jgi:ABC-type transporter Mla subunit MlaD